MRIVVFLIVFVGFGVLFAQQSSESFNVTATDKYFHVIGPVNWKAGTSMILQNKTLVTIYGEVRAGESRRKVGTFSVRPGEFMSMDLKLNKGENAVLIPLSPAFQEDVLEFGRRPNEIPPQR